MPEDAAREARALRRRLGLPLLVLYGVGITIGAGIYVLIGAVAGRSGVYAHWAFVLAAIVMALTVASYAELATRYPVSAGEAAYVRAAFRWRALSTATGLTTLVTGGVAAAAVTLGGVGYIRQFVALPPDHIAAAIVLVLGAVAAWGILESVLLAGIFTLIEAGGLVLLIAAALHSDLSFAPVLVSFPPISASVLSGIAFSSLLAFFAFVGFEDLANVVEEATIPHRNIPLAMALTLAIRPLRPRRRDFGERGISRRACAIGGAVKPGLSQGGGHEPNRVQRDRGRCHAQYSPGTNDDGLPRPLRHGPAGRFAKNPGTRSRANGDSADRDRHRHRDSNCPGPRFSARAIG